MKRLFKSISIQLSLLFYLISCSVEGGGSSEQNTTQNSSILTSSSFEPSAPIKNYIYDNVIQNISDLFQGTSTVVVTINNNKLAVSLVPVDGILKVIKTYKNSAGSITTGVLYSNLNELFSGNALLCGDEFCLSFSSLKVFDRDGIDISSKVVISKQFTNQLSQNDDFYAKHLKSIQSDFVQASSENNVYKLNLGAPGSLYIAINGPLVQICKVNSQNKTLKLEMNLRLSSDYTNSNPKILFSSAFLKNSETSSSIAQQFDTNSLKLNHNQTFVAITSSNSSGNITVTNDVGGIACSTGWNSLKSMTLAQLYVISNRVLKDFATLKNSATNIILPKIISPREGKNNYESFVPANAASAASMAAYKSIDSIAEAALSNYKPLITATNDASIVNAALVAVQAAEAAAKSAKDLAATLEIAAPSPANAAATYRAYNNIIPQETIAINQQSLINAPLIELNNALVDAEAVLLEARNSGAEISTIDSLSSSVESIRALKVSANSSLTIINNLVATISSSYKPAAFASYTAAQTAADNTPYYARLDLGGGLIAKLKLTVGLPPEWCSDGIIYLRGAYETNPPLFHSNAMFTPGPIIVDKANGIGSFWKAFKIILGQSPNQTTHFEVNLQRYGNLIPIPEATFLSCAASFMNNPTVLPVSYDVKLAQIMSNEGDPTPILYNLISNGGLTAAINAQSAQIALANSLADKADAIIDSYNLDNSFFSYLSITLPSVGDMYTHYINSLIESDPLSSPSVNCQGTVYRQQILNIAHMIDFKKQCMRSMKSFYIKLEDYLNTQPGAMASFDSEVATYLGLFSQPNQIARLQYYQNKISACGGASCSSLILLSDKLDIDNSNTTDPLILNFNAAQANYCNRYSCN